jgi:hypothetical protein
MGISINFNGAALSHPGAYSATTVALSGGFPLAPAGVVGIVGEAEGGAPGSASDITSNFYSSEQIATIVSTYKSGPIVEAARLLAGPSADSRVANGAQRIFIYKTNASSAATATVTGAGTLSSINYGLIENLINFTVTAGQAEVTPTMTVTYMPDATSASTLKFRVNGGAEASVAIAANDTPTTVKTNIDAVAGVACTGGVDRGILAASQVTTGTVALSSTGNVVTITIAANTWAVTPTVGDILRINTGSPIIGAASANAGGYLVTAATSSVITAVKFGDPSVACANVGAVDIAATTDVTCYSPLVISVDAATASGSGASLEMFDGGGAVAVEELSFGGVNRNVLNAAKVSDGSTIALAVAGAVGTFTISSSFAASPSVGDLLWVRPGSPIAGGALQNVGAWRVSASSATSITATKISGSPIAVSAADIAATTDVEVYAGVLSSTAAPIVNTSSAELQRLMSFNRQSDNLTEDSTALGGNVAMLLGYNGTTASVTITSTTLSTTVVGGSGANLAVTLASYRTLSDLATFINAQTGYSCAVANALYGQLAPSALDQVSALGICSSVAGDKTGRIKKDSYEVAAFAAASSLVTLTRTTFAGLPSATARTFLSGGAKGGSTAAAVQAGIDAMQKVRINTLVPLFSLDATAAVLAGLTDPSSTFQIAAINAAAKSHCLLMSNTKNRSERNAMCSIKDSFLNSKAAANNIAHQRVSMAIQDVKILQVDGTLGWQLPWALAAVAAGMQAGAKVGEPMTFKSINISGLRHQDFDPATQFDDAISNGILYAEAPSNGGFRFALGNTTYAADASFVNNRISVQYAADYFAYNLRQQLEAIFVGVSAAIADPTSVKNAVIAFCGEARAAGVIVGDSTNEGLGFKNLTVTVTGNVMSVNLTITPPQGVDFILNNIVLDNIRASA